MVAFREVDVLSALNMQGSATLVSSGQSDHYPLKSDEYNSLSMYFLQYPD